MKNVIKTHEMFWKEKILEDAKHVDNPFVQYASNPFILPGRTAVEAKDIADAKAAVYVLSRNFRRG